VDCAFLAQVARALQAPEELAMAIAAANTARHVQELIAAAGLSPFYTRLAELAAEQCSQTVAARLQIEVVLFDFEGRVLSKSEK
jgi:cobalt-precorrin-5B (C1)-methyltransferase